MKKMLTAAERLYVAADFKSTGAYARKEVRSQVIALAKNLKRTGVGIKVNSALRLCGYNLINELQTLGVRVFADLKLNDIPETLKTDGLFLRDEEPQLLTVMCSTGIAGMQALKGVLPNTEVLGVTVLTSLEDADTCAMYMCDTLDATMRLAQFAADAKIDGLICSPKEVAALRAKFGTTLSLNTPGIRPSWAIVYGDHQSPDRVMTTERAIRAGSDRVIIGRPITESPDPYAATMRTLDEIASAIDL